MNEPKKPELGFFASLAKAGVTTVRENYARRLGRAYARGFEAGRDYEHRDDARAGKSPPANPYVDDDGQPRYDAAGEVILPDA